MQISGPGHLLLRAAKENWGGPAHSPSGRHIINQANSKGTQKQNQKHTKPNNKTRISQNRTHKNDWHPVHLWIQAGDGSIVSSHPSMAKKQENKQRKRGKQTHTRPYTQLREATQHHAETGDPQPGSPRSHGLSRMA